MNGKMYEIRYNKYISVKNPIKCVKMCQNAKLTNLDLGTEESDIN